MTLRRHSIAVLAAGLMATAGAVPARACGFDGVFDGNFGVSHPLAMAVAVAMRQAVLDGTMPAGAAAPILDGAAGLWRTTARIHALARALSSAAPGEPQGFVLHLADSGLWARLTPALGGLAVEVHVDGPRSGETVVVTHGAVLERLLEARISARQAAGLGLIARDGEQAAAAAIGRRFCALDDTTAARSTATDLRQRLPWRAAAGRPAAP